MKTVHDVIISGAGPVGLFLACEVALAGCSVLILEKATHPDSPLKRIPFGIRGLSAPTIEALYRRGLMNELALHKRLKNPHLAKPGARRQVGHFAGIPFFETDVDTSRWHRLPGSTDTSLISEIEELETILIRRAETLGVVIRRGVSVINFSQTDEEVIVITGNESFTGKWLVGCDGSRSAVRKAGRFEFAGTEPEFTGYSTQIEIADPEKLGLGRNMTPTGMYLQSQPGYILIQDFDGGEFHRSEKPITVEHLQQVLRRVSQTDVTITALHNATAWTDRARQATTYRNGRVLLAGDAAHIHAPLGGQGLNLGLGDAMNLGWKLAATINGKAPDNLLDTYYMERYPIGEQVLNWSRAQVSIMKPDPAARAMNAVIRDLMETRDGATYFAARVWGVFTHYDLRSSHPLVGRSMPNVAFEDGTTIGDLMYTGDGIILDFENDDLVKNLADNYGMKYVSAKSTDEIAASTLLIRPDGIVAWASDAAPDYNELRNAADRWFVSNTKR